MRQSKLCGGTPYARPKHQQFIRKVAGPLWTTFMPNIRAPSKAEHCLQEMGRAIHHCPSVRGNLGQSTMVTIISIAPLAIVPLSSLFMTACVIMFVKGTMAAWQQA